VSRTFLVSGRRVQDWTDCGKTIPPDVVRCTCMLCGVELTISAGGARKLEQVRMQNAGPAGAACVACIVLVGSTKKVERIETSETGAALLESSQPARDLVQFLMERVK
jgi:hypothetical protein